MPHLEPTYLRYIYDGLIKGSIHPENAAELPEGLIGLYEEAFDERTSVFERQKLLQRFAIWALLKKEVSAAFVAEILGETEDDIQEFISTYSAWFKSPESGKYQLYHERLKVYLLQKLSEGEVHTLHEKLITRLERAIEEQKADEFEWYGLEFLTSHLSVTAMLNSDGKKLIELAYSQTHWQRQLKICKGYSWTKNGLKEVMAWASKYNDDEVIECGLQMVDLHHQEQNAAPQIVALVAEGDLDAALKRIEQFGGNDKETQKKKIIIYFLCLWQIVNSTEQDTADLKIKAEKILEHFNKTLAHEITPIVWELMFSRVLSTFHLLFKLNTIGVNYYDFLKQFKSNKDDQIFKWDMLELDDLKDSNEIMKWSQLIDSLPCEISKCSLFAQLAVKSHKYQNKLSKELNKVSGKLFKSITSLKLLSDNGSCYIASDLKSYLKDNLGMDQIHGRPMHPQTQGKIERYHRTMKNVVKLDNYYAPEELEKALEKFVYRYNNERYHESLNNLTPADVYYGRGDLILKERARLKSVSLYKRRMEYQQFKMTEKSENQKNNLVLN